MNQRTLTRYDPDQVREVLHRAEVTDEEIDRLEGLLDDEQPLYWRYALSLINALRAERARTIQLLRTVDELRGVPASEDPVISEQAVS